MNSDIQFKFGFAATRTLIFKILTDALNDDNYPEGWSLQGFGMLRLNLPGDWRLNIWHKQLRVQNVSMIHDHPWHFESQIVSGELRNTRFEVTHLDSDLFKNGGPEVFHRREIQPGPGGGLLVPSSSLNQPSLVRLHAYANETYGRGMVYQQSNDEVHLSNPEDGTVTLNRRFGRSKADVARVFWPFGEQWVSAEPRSAKRHEISFMVNAAIDAWGK